MIRFSRPPTDDDELHAATKALIGLDIPRVQVCPNHVAPFTAFSHAFFARPPNTALWYASRGCGKSYMLAGLGLVKTIFHMGDTTILGGSIHQSNNVYGHMVSMMDTPNAPSELIEKFTKTELLFKNKTKINPLSASSTSVRGPHPLLHLLDEIDEMDWDIYQSSLGQALQQDNSLGVDMREYVVKSSTWQHIIGTFATVLQEHKNKKLPVFTWCYKEMLKPHGWMDPDFIERKRATVPDELFRIEFDLGEPSGEHSVFDIQRLSEMFLPMEEIPYLSRHSQHDDLWIYEEPNPAGMYCIGVDLAKAKDWTVAVVARVDVEPIKIVAELKVGRIPWDQIIGKLKNLRFQFMNAAMGHDGTGLGSVVTDLLEEHSSRYLFIGEQRKKLLNECIANIEDRTYRFPKGDNSLYDGFRGATVSDVWGGAQQNHHLPDELAAMAVLNAICAKYAVGTVGRGIPTKGDRTSFMYEEMTGGTKQMVESIYFEEYEGSESRTVFVPSL
jgi:hypothetical protein